MSCDIIIPVWNELQSTKECIESLRANTLYPYKLILIDNGSKVDTQNYLKGLEREVILIRNEKNEGFIKAINQGLKVSKAPYVCILNNDTLPARGWLSELMRFAEKHPGVGLLNPICGGHKEENVTVNEYAKKLISNRDKHMEMNQCQGFCMLIKREVIDKIGYLDERFGLGGFDDTDYSMRAHQAGYRCVSVYSSYVYHKEHKSFDALGDRKDIQKEAEKEYFKKWPKHLRIAVIFSIRKNTTDEAIKDVLNAALFLARKWCWVNLLVFGNASTKKRINDIKAKIDFPLHQNIKFNYLNRIFKSLEISVRLLERSFGKKSRKKYDIVLSSDKGANVFLRFLCSFQKAKVYSLCLKKEELRNLIDSARPTRKNDGNMKCDIILPVCNQYKFTKNCIESIIRNTDTPYRLIVINNGTNIDTRKLLDKIESDQNIETTIVHNSKNVGWVDAINRGIDISNAPYVCFQNDDTVVTKGWLRKMIEILSIKKELGLINPEWEGNPHRLSIDKFNKTLEEKGKRFIETDWCRGFSVVMKREVIEKIGKLDYAYSPGYFDDVDYSVTAIEAGYLCIRALNTYVYHHRNVTACEVFKGKEWSKLHETKKLIYYQKWGKPLKIVIAISERDYKDRSKLNDVEDAIFYLARKQHHLEVWVPKGDKGRFNHTNVKIKVIHPLLLKSLLSIAILMNKKKKKEKRYSAIFKTWEIVDFSRVVKKETDLLKEKTKVLMNV